MEPLAKLKRRSTILIGQVQQTLASMPLPRRRSPSQAQQQHGSVATQGTWERIDVPPLARSAHSLNVVCGAAYIFGGGSGADPVDNDMHVVGLPCSGAAADYFKVEAVAARPEAQRRDDEQPWGPDADDADDASGLHHVPLESGPGPHEGRAPSKGKQPAMGERPTLDHVPAPRVGHATAVIGSRIFLFGGRGGPDMAPLDEAGRVWVYDTRSHTWTQLDPVPPPVRADAVVSPPPRPAPRSHHCAAATDSPRHLARRPRPQSQSWRQWALGGDPSRTGTPQNPVVGSVAEDAVDDESEGYGTLFVHAGCLASGECAADVWAFDVRSRSWTELPPAPGPPRRGSAMCVSKSRLFRFGGFDGETELGGQLDLLHLELETFDDATTHADVSVRNRPSGWQTIFADRADASPAAIPAQPYQPWPAARGAASLQALSAGGGREFLVLVMGERSPGAFLDDVWTFQVPPLGMTAASLTDAVLQAVGRRTGEGRWVRVATCPHDDDANDGQPAPRAWLASAPMGDVEESGIVIWGGLGEADGPMGDGWILRLDV